jgi:hypothetical protein
MIRQAKPHNIQSGVLHPPPVWSSSQHSAHKSQWSQMARKVAVQYGRKACQMANRQRASTGRAQPRLLLEILKELNKPQTMKPHGSRQIAAPSVQPSGGNLRQLAAQKTITRQVKWITQLPHQPNACQSWHHLHKTPQ